MKIREVCKLLQISNVTVKRRIREGLLKATMVKPPKGVAGNIYWDITQDSLEKYLKLYN